MKKSILRVCLVLLGCLCFFETIESVQKKDVEEVYYWQEVIYEALPLEDDTLIGPYPYHIPSNNDVTATAYHAQSGLVIATVGRVRPGIPSTLNAFCVADYEEGTSPHLWGFPDYQKNTLKDSFYERKVESRRNPHKYSYGYQKPQKPMEDFTIVHTYFPNLDNRCNRLFMVDTGFLHYSYQGPSPAVGYFVQNPAILVFELPFNGCKTRQFPLLRRVEIPNHLWKFAPGLTFITVDYQPKGTCDDIYLYITNTFDSSLIVYDYKRDSFWSFADATMKPYDSFTSYTFDTIPWELSLGIAQVVLGWPDKHGNKNAYFAPASGIGEYLVSTKLLKNYKRAPYYYNPNDFSLIGYRGCKAETFSQVFDTTTGVIFFGEMQSKRVRCWNTQLPLNPDTIGVVYESDALPFVAIIDVDANGYLWFHSSYLPLMFLTELPLNTSEVNSRTFRVKVSEAIKGTVCDTSNLYYV